MEPSTSAAAALNAIVDRLVPDSAPEELRGPGLAYRAVWRLGVAIDPLVWTHTQFESRLHLRASLPATIQREGKLLYAG